MGWSRTDDLDGSSPAEQVTFGLDGVAYTIDLGAKEHEKLRAALQRYVTVAEGYGELPQPVSSPLEAEAEVTPVAKPVRSTRSVRPRGRRPARTRAVPAAAADHRTIRAWAMAQENLNVGPKGRIPQSVIDAYQGAHA